MSATAEAEYGRPVILRPPRILPELGIVEIPLTQGKVAIIDICDAERVLHYNWHASKERGDIAAAPMIAQQSGISAGSPASMKYNRGRS